MKKKLVASIIILLFSMFSNLVFAVSDDFTQEELEYIENHKKVYIAGNYDLFPIEYYDGESYKGILPDIFAELSSITGIEFVYINKDEDWEQYVENNQVEIISGIDNQIDQEYYNLRSSIEIIKFPIDAEEKIFLIAFTSIADDELISIVNKSLEQMDEFTKQEILISNIFEEISSNETNYALITMIIILLISIIIIIFIINRKYKKEVLQAKYIDDITHLGNYQMMKKRYNKLITDDNRTSYCIVNLGIDISHIEEVYGYSEVELILKDIACILSENIKQNELFARIYKDAFVIMADYISEDNIKERVKFIINEIKRKIKETKMTYRLNSFAGIYILKQTDISLETAVYNAMVAKKVAKEQNTDIEICTQALRIKTRKEKSLEKEMLLGLRNNEFITYLQPMIRVNGSGIEFFEELARWDSPKLGLVKPSSFLTIFEKNNLIDQLDFQMYENVCKKISKMQRKRIVFCNFSPKTVQNNMFINNLKKIAEKYDVPKKYIGIFLNAEMTNNSLANLKVLTRKIKDAGFLIILNDFGITTYSFKELSQFQADYVKISPKLIENLNDYRTVQVVKEIIDILHELKIKVICEDFNTTKLYASILKDIGCDMIEGKIYHQPIPLEEIL